MNKLGQIMPVPIVFPYRVGKAESKRCPKCKKKENIIDACKNCNYIYPEGKYEYPYWHISLLLTIGTIYLGAYLISLVNYGWWSIPTIIIILFGALFLILCQWAYLARDKKVRIK